jgi:hypothetical protein
MKGKLNKVDNGYVLLVDNIMYATDNDKLSQSNCDEIFGVVDVEKLAREEACDCEAPECDVRDDYKKGFNKAMELDKDKLFTEDDVNLAFALGKNNDESRINKLINSRLQPTEIEVEILCLHTGNPEYTTNTGLPKLDEDGCLILKKL